MKKYKSELRKAMHQDAVSLYKVGAISEAEMRHFDEACLVLPAAPVSCTATQESAVLPHSGAPVYARGKYSASI
jgi:DNA-binding transcriptional regulator YiaG